MNVMTIKKAVGILSLMKYFPSSEDAQAALMEMLGTMCANEEQVLWLARRVTALYSEWPGTREVRAVFCGKYRPVDGIEAESAIYLEGIPAEPKPVARQIGAGERKAIG